MSWSGPTLGWGVLEWMATYLPSPRDASVPFILTDEQAEFVLAWYSVDRRGEFIYRRSISERAKGWGKSPLHAAIALAELGAGSPLDSAPVVFDGWRGDEPRGRPWGVMGKPKALVQIAAVSEDQTDNTYSVVYELLTANDHKAAIRLGIDDGRTRLYLKGRPGTLEPVTASGASREGAPSTYVLLDETHLYLPRNGGVRLAAVLRRNVAKMGGRTQETTNAPILGEGSVAERSGNAASREAGILWDAKRPPIEPSPDWPDDKLLEALDETYGDAVWVDRPRLLADIRDPATEWHDALRFFFNTRNAGVGHAVDPTLWDALAVPQEVPAGTEIGIGFDGSISRDATVIRGCTREGYSFLIGAWVRPTGADMDIWRAEHPGKEWEVDRLAVDQTMSAAFERYRVGALRADPPYWRTEIDTWTLRWPDRVLALDTQSATRFAPAVDRWLTGLATRTHTHDGDPITTAHVKAAIRKKVHLAAPEDGRTRYVLDKGSDGRQIDGAVADVLAYEAAMTMPEAGVTTSVYANPEESLFL